MKEQDRDELIPKAVSEPIYGASSMLLDIVVITMVLFVRYHRKYHHIRKKREQKQE